MKSGSRELELAVPVEDVWAALTGLGRRDWYFGLTPEGEFVDGGQIRWIDGGGRVVIESEVTGLSPGAHLALRDRFVFASNLAALRPHVTSWQVKATTSGCVVKNSWQAEGAAAALLEGDADNVLRGLRLALDPAEQAAIARRESIGAIEVRDVTPELVPDYLAYFDHDAFRDYPSWQFCYCMETHRTQSNEEWATRTAADNRRDMAEMLARGEVTGLLAYADGKPVGWCNYGETTRLAGVMHRFGLDPADHQGVGSIACFVIAPQYRGQGVASRLLDAAVERMRAKGLRTVEAYPAKDGKGSAQHNFRGPLSLFLRAGFEPYRETERYVVVRKAL